MSSLKAIESRIQIIPDFPKPGILFRDITPVLAHGQSLQLLTHAMCEHIPPTMTHIAAIESRGFIIGSAMAHQMGCGLILLRKPQKLPRSTFTQSYSLEYGQNSLEVHQDDLTPSDSVVIVDDVLATGGTAAAAEALCAQTGAKVLKHIFMIELTALNGRAKLKSPHSSLFPFT